MKTFFAALLVCACAHAAAAQEGQPAPTYNSGGGTAKIERRGLVKRGAPLGESPTVSFSVARKEPQKYAGKLVHIAGRVRRVCKKEGCWMEFHPGSGGGPVRVTFKDHAFFVPKDADGMMFRAEGELKVKRLSKEEVEHLVKEDGATVKTNPDGTADEVTFVATGVELWKAEL